MWFLSFLDNSIYYYDYDKIFICCPQVHHFDENDYAHVCVFVIIYYYCVDISYSKNIVYILQLNDNATRYRTIYYINVVFTAFFVAEALVKIIAFTPPVSITV